MKRDDLDQLLRQWAVRHGAEGPDAQRLAQRVVDALDRPGGSDEVGVDAPRPGATLRTRLLWAVLGAAATLAVVSLWLGVLRRSPRHEEVAVEGPRIEILQPQIEANSRLFAETGRLFGPDLRWIAETDGEVELGLQPVAGTPLAASPVLWIRVLVVRRAVGGSSWQTLLTADVLTRNEQYVEARADHGGGGRLALWGYVLPDGNVAVDSRLRLTAPTRLSADVSSVFAPGKPVQILAVATDEGETRVFQVVTLLHPGEASSWSDT
jgi:hypothetical protein